ncbi:MAG: ABC transporter permease [Desulfarculus sp.]|nr:ABC transporter permease [Desulfarculus sp.]
MNWVKLLITSGQALMQHKLRTGLSMLGIVFAVMAVIAMLAMAEGAKRETLEQIGQLGTQNVIVRQAALTQGQEAAARERLSRGLRQDDAALLERLVPGVAAVAGLKQVRAAVAAASKDDPLEVLAVTAAYPRALSLDLAQGRFIAPLDVLNKNQVCVLGWESSRLLGAQGVLGGMVSLEDRPFLVVGILRERRWVKGKSAAIAARNYNRAIFVPLGAQPAPRLGDKREPELSEILLRMAQAEQVSPAAAVARQVLMQSHGGFEDFQVVVPQELINQAQRTQRVFNVVLFGIAGISLLVGGIGIMNMMLASVSERTREIGIRRAIGASAAHIAAHFLGEAVLLTLGGGLMGIVLGMLGVLVINMAAGWKSVVTFWPVALSLGMAVGVGILSGLYPALRAASLDPAAALRHE